MRQGAIWWGAAAVLTMGILSPAMARPQYLNTFKAHYKTSEGKPTLNAANCGLCHVGMPREAKWNPYGQALGKALGARNVQDMAKIAAALEAAGKEKRTPDARRTFGEIIQADRAPGAAPMAQADRGQAPRTAPAAPVSGTWEPLFNGVNMDGWTKMHAGNWTVQDGLLKYTGGGNGWLKSNRQFGNYALVVVWRYPRAGNNDSGIFLRARADDSRNPWPQSPQLNMGPGDNLGSIGGTQGTRARADLIKANDWNVYQITVRDGMATLAINGTVAWDRATGASLSGMGHIGIQAENHPLDVASIWIMPLP